MRNTHLAGLFDPPPAMFKSIGVWMAETYAGHILKNIEPMISKAQDATVLFKKGIETNKAAEVLVDSAASLKVGEFVKFPLVSIYMSTLSTEQWGIKRLEDGFPRNYQDEERRIPMYTIGYGNKVVSWTPANPPLSYKYMGNISLEGAQQGLREMIWGNNSRLQGAINNPPTSEDGAPDLVELMLLKHELMKYTSKAKSYVTSAKRDFQVDVSGWKYIKPDETPPASFSWGRISVVLDFKGTQFKGGSWNRETRVLIVELGSGSASSYIRTSEQARTVGEFKHGLSEMLRTLRHELRHMGQDLLATLHQVNDFAGLPGKSIRDPKYDARGKQLDAVPNAEGKVMRLIHPLLDVEFYTRLGDEIDRFVRHSKKIPDSLLAESVKVWVGASPDRVLKDSDGVAISGIQEFFMALKKFQPEKWRKAVSEFYKGIEDAGIDLSPSIVQRVAARWLLV